MAKKVLVTGGTGYIGSWVVKLLLENGYTVRMAVRNKNRDLAYLHAIAAKSSGTLEVWEADLLTEGAYDAPAKGADAIIHMASPFTFRFKDAQKDLIDPAVKGTRNVLEAANKSGTVKRVVLTSSVAAVYGDNADMAEQGLQEFTEEHFNTSSSFTHQPYSYSKVMAEKEAWKIHSAQTAWQLVVINPALVLGPALSHLSDSESLAIMKDLLTGRYRMGAPELCLGFVDVRDVAAAHLLALENEKAEGRYILSERTASIMDLAQTVRQKFGSKYKLPLMKSPKLMLHLVGWLFGLTSKFISRNVGYPLKLNATKSKQDLGLKYTPLEQTVEDMVLQMQKDKLVD